MSELIINFIQLEYTFTDLFKTNLSNNNRIDLSKKIAIVYGANGTGKTSFVKILSGEHGEYNVLFNRKQYTSSSEEKLFYVIKDQINRNIIKASEEEFLLGDDINKEFKLSKEINEKSQNIKNTILGELKKIGITTKGHKAISLLSADNNDVKKFLESFANNKNKGKDISVEELLDILNNFKDTLINDYDDDKMTFFRTDIGNQDSSWLLHFLGIKEKLLKTYNKHPNIKELSENEVAIDILNRFSYKKDCVVCDNQINDHKELISKKEYNRKIIREKLKDEESELLEYLKSIENNDPFNIRDAIYLVIEKGETEKFYELCEDIKKYIEIYKQKFHSAFSSIPDLKDLKERKLEYDKIVKSKLAFSDDDINLINEISQSCLSRELKINRDNNNNIKILFNDKKILGIDRGDLGLSTGEQNFLSLAFELILARNKTVPIKSNNNFPKIIVIDDPISSFDSIYKNKIAYLILKILNDRKTVILSHNVDLIRLLEFQHQKSFNLYLLNTVEGESNGFHLVSENEVALLLQLNELSKFFREKVFKDNIIKSNNNFYIAVLPFLRGYATITGKSDEYAELSKIMHSYESSEVNICEVYSNLFGVSNLGIYTISSSDIVNLFINKKSYDNMEIIDKKIYPLLNKTLVHSFYYLSIRLYVEKCLLDKYNPKIKNQETLSKIIENSLPNSNKNFSSLRNKLMSKKTLINEFNHYEGNLSIFQPAIDITDTILKKELEEIKQLMENLPNA